MEKKKLFVSMPSYPFQFARNTKFPVIQPDKKKVWNSPWNFSQVKEILFELINNLSFDFRALSASVRLDSYGPKSMVGFAFSSAVKGTFCEI